MTKSNNWKEMIEYLSAFGVGQECTMYDISSMSKYSKIDITYSSLKQYLYILNSSGYIKIYGRQDNIHFEIKQKIPHDLSIKSIKEKKMKEVLVETTEKSNGIKEAIYPKPVTEKPVADNKDHLKKALEATERNNPKTVNVNISMTSAKDMFKVSESIKLKSRKFNQDQVEGERIRTKTVLISICATVREEEVFQEFVNMFSSKDTFLAFETFNISFHDEENIK